MELRLRARVADAFGYTPARPDFARGLRAATATVLPLVVADRTHRAAFTLVAVGAWLGTLVDTGGAIGARARTVAALGLAGPAALVLGALCGRWSLLGALGAFVWCAATALLTAYGAAGATLGTMLAALFCIGLGLGGTLHAALLTGALFAAGVAWAMLLALTLWRIHPHGPARAATGACYARLAEYVRAVRALADVGGEGAAREQWLALAREQHRAVREALEVARATAGATRARRAGSSPDGDRLRVAIASADLLFGTLIALEAEASASAGTATVAAPALGAFADTLAALGDAVRARSPARRRVPMEALEAELKALRGRVASAPRETHRALHLERASVLLERAVTHARAALEATAGERELSPAARIALGTPAPPDPWTPLRDALTPGSRALLHALRTGLLAALSVPLAARLGLTHPSWFTVTTVLVLQPYAGGTRSRVLQRVAGTVAGATLAAALAATVRAPALIAVVMFPLAVLAVALRPVSYGLFTLFLTPIFVLLAERAPGDWSLALARGTNTLAGGALALVGAYALWPARERQRLPVALGAVVAAQRAYLATATARWRGDAGVTREGVAAARRAVGLATNDAEASLQRVVGEPARDEAKVEAASTLLTYSRRVASSIASLSFNATHGVPIAADADTVARQLDAALADLERALLAERAPGLAPPDPYDLRADPGDADTVPAAALIEAQLRRVVRQVTVMHAAVARLAGASATSAQTGPGAPETPRTPGT